MLWFGKRDNAPIYDDCPQVSTPIGTVCDHCVEEIQMGESGFIVSGRLFHQECWLRLIIGSVGHQMKLCTCFKGPEAALEDPENLSIREAAKLAVEYSKNKHLPVN
jgi:hypothetical protein